jgi:two-component system, chemotaxis family, sensor kinase CheA
MNDFLRLAYLDEVPELLTELEQALLQLEANPTDQELIGRVFRSLHTIKGSGAMFGFDKVASLTHGVETVYDLVRGGRIAVDKNLVDLTLAARDCIKLLLLSETGEDQQLEHRTAQISTSFRIISDPFLTQPVTERSAPPDIPNQKRNAATYRIRFIPEVNILRQGGDPLLLLEELRKLGECRIVAQTCNIPPLEDLEPDRCHIFWDIVLTTNAGLDAIKDVFIFVDDTSDIRIDLIDEGTLAENSETRRKLGEILLERGDISREDLERVLAGRKYIGQMLVDEGLVTPDKVLSAVEEIEHLREKTRLHEARESASSIRVPAEKLDRLVDLVGELVTVQARLTQTAVHHQITDLLNIAEEVERLTEELRDTSLDIRMLPIGTAFSKFRRIIRDLSQDMGKDIRLVTDGAETELDKTVIERLNDPLVHIIRNSIDHGIEPADERVARGKPRQGTITLAACHSGDSVLVRISDDGRGLDRESIYAKGVATGLIPPNTELSDRQLFPLIFTPGFTTAREVTGISGRGVGMDVVKKTIDSMQGSIDLHSVKGKGTTISIRLPLTLAIVESLLVKIGRDHFVLPLNSVDECVEIINEEIVGSRGKHIATVRGSQVPYVHLRNRFAIADDLPEIHQVVIGRVNGMQVGFLVDDVIGEHQTVIKSLGKMYRQVSSFSGATILGDGTVALILNLEELLEHELRAGCEDYATGVSS